ncbi:hypothetical protein PQI51_07515 [Microbacterium esteraromaticum]|uniref:hypothetical protein n=1 Tax=Microbacterium esteraromaticum TaxID=57043 RepID=UPI0030B418DF
MSVDPVRLTALTTPREVAHLVSLLPLVDPPAMVRLEPDSISGDPAPGIEARIADPAWMLGRQWQFGELIGEDAGTTVSVTVSSTALPITAWAPLRPGAARVGDDEWRPWRSGALLEELAMDVPSLGFGAGLRQRAEAGQQLVDMLVDAGEDALASALPARYPLALPPDPLSPEEPVLGESDAERTARESRVAARDALDPAAKRLLRLLGGTVPDGRAVRDAIRVSEPDWVADAHDPGATRAVLVAWADWLGEDESSGGAWDLERLEYRFAIRFGGADHCVVAQVTQFGAASVRWSDLEWIPDVHPPLPDGAPSGDPISTTFTMLATPLRYPGMPADRYWQLEDGRVDLGAIEAQAYDLARLCLAEFAMSSGDDWLQVPVDGLLGAVNTIDRVELRDNFGGDPVVVGELADPAFAMFRVADAAGRRLPGVVLPPVAADITTGRAHEEVLFLRDQMANMAWAIEQTVQGRSGDPRSRSSERPPEPDPWPVDLQPDDLVYRLQTPIPEHWIPLVPVAVQPGRISLRKGAMIRTVLDEDGQRAVGDGEMIHPVGVTLRPGEELTFPGEEIPREGVAVAAVPMLARRADGRYVRWSGYRIGTGSGEGSSRLAWDAALSTREMNHTNEG